MALTSYQIMYMPYTAGRSTHVHVLDPQNRHFTKLDYRKRRKLKVLCQIIFVHLIKSTNIFVFEKWVISRDRHIQTKPQRMQNQWNQSDQTSCENKIERFIKRLSNKEKNQKNIIGFGVVFERTVTLIHCFYLFLCRFVVLLVQTSKCLGNYNWKPNMESGHGYWK